MNLQQRLTKLEAQTLEDQPAVVWINPGQTQDEARNKAKIKVVMTAVNRSAIVSHIRNEMTAAGAEVMGCEIAQRTSYAEAELAGNAPCYMGKSAQKAADEIQALVAELMR